MYNGFRGCKEHRDRCWGDVKLKETVDGKEYFELNERQTKKRTGSDWYDIRVIPSKIFATDVSEKGSCSGLRKLYAQTRPEK